MQSPGSTQSPSVCTSGDRSPSAAQPDPYGPPGGHCGPPVPRFLAGSTPGGPEERERERKSGRKGTENIMRDNDDSQELELTGLADRRTAQVGIATDSTDIQRLIDSI